MPESPRPLTTAVTPSGVLQLVRAAAQRGLLDDVESLASGLEHAGWRRDTHGGWWTYEHDPAWTLGSSVDPAGFSAFATGADDLVAAAADEVASHLSGGWHRRTGRGRAGRLRRSALAGRSGQRGAVLHPTKTVQLPHKTIEVPCTLQLAASRPDTPSD